MICSGSTLAADIRYAFVHWEGLTRFLDDGHLELDTSPVENTIRAVAPTRNYLMHPPSGASPAGWRCSAMRAARKLRFSRFFTGPVDFRLCTYAY
ncbi:MAG: transposase [Reyranella sp.]